MYHIQTKVEGSHYVVQHCLALKTKRLEALTWDALVVEWVPSHSGCTRKIEKKNAPYIYMTDRSSGLCVHYEKLSKIISR